MISRAAEHTQAGTVTGKTSISKFYIAPDSESAIMISKSFFRTLMSKFQVCDFDSDTHWHWLGVDSERRRVKFCDFNIGPGIMIIRSSWLGSDIPWPVDSDSGSDIKVLSLHGVLSSSLRYRSLRHFQITVIFMIIYAIWNLHHLDKTRRFRILRYIPVYTGMRV